MVPNHIVYVTVYDRPDFCWVLFRRVFDKPFFDEGPIGNKYIPYPTSYRRLLRVLIANKLKP